jgi:predicted DNA-binding transcriptional regulator AlpA
MEEAVERHRNHGGGSAILTPADLAARWGKNLSTIWRWAKAGMLPPKMKLGPKSVGFLLADIEAYEERMKEASA